jgi:hypothetical protein
MWLVWIKNCFLVVYTDTVNIIRWGIRMKKYEYKCVSIWGFGEKTTRILNEYGRQGWELICAWGVWHYFKKELVE